MVNIAHSALESVKIKVRFKDQLPALQLQEMTQSVLLQTCTGQAAQPTSRRPLSEFVLQTCKSSSKVNGCIQAFRDHQSAADTGWTQRETCWDRLLKQQDMHCSHCL